MGHMAKRIYVIENGLGVLVLCLLCMVVGLKLAERLERRPAGFHFITVTVRKGDTLWNLARRCTEPEENLLERIALIEEVNGLRGKAVLPGQRLRIPVSAGMACRLHQAEIVQRPGPGRRAHREASPYREVFSQRDSASEIR